MNSAKKLALHTLMGNNSCPQLLGLHEESLGPIR